MERRFSMKENFNCRRANGLPRAISVERNSAYVHNHLRWENETCYICVEGNKFFLETPALSDVEARFRFRFHNTYGRHGSAVYFRYDRVMRRGMSVELMVDQRGASLQLCRVDGDQRQVLACIGLTEMPGEENELCVYVCGGSVSAKLNGRAYCFEPVGEICSESGGVGAAFIGGVGEIAPLELEAASDDELPTEEILPETTARIPLRNGGNIPYTLVWSMRRVSGKCYLKYRLTGGPQDRISSVDYPRFTDQYTREQARITRPYIAAYSESGDRICRNTIYPGCLTVTDPGLQWKELLREYFRVVDLPLEGEFPVENGCAARIAFGYEGFRSEGYGMQTETDVEFLFDAQTGRLISGGKAPDAECIQVSSPADKQAVRIIPNDAYDAAQVRQHMADNHFFAEGEEIRFLASVQTARPAEFLTLSAVLQNVYGDPVSEMTVIRAKGGWTCTCPAMPVGVYRAAFTAFFGDRPLLIRDIVLEVFDPEGRKCAPIESGLPFLYSMPNEQRYLDRDAFDPWSPFPDCNMEHYYAACSFTGDVALKKKTWEIGRLFARKWYVWNSDHRTLTKGEFERHHEEILRHADYVYYPLRHEWAVMRHDYPKLASYNGWGLTDYLHDFLAIHPEYDFGIAPDADRLTQEQLNALMQTCADEWMRYAIDRATQDAIKDNEWIRQVNPGAKRACYGPYPIYGTPICTHHAQKYIGHPSDERLAEVFFNGFAQLEDYPYSCCYNTYKGAFHVTHTLLHSPGIAIYPEQYTASDGGCIDGAVKNANPPLGKYDMPPYFNVTHAYEYVYNTAHLTKNGFRFWSKRGFMQRDFTPEFVDEFIRNWKHVLSHEPAAPLRSMAFLSEIPDWEDRVKQAGGELVTLNRSDNGMAYVFETVRRSGLPNGFAFCWDTLNELTPDMTDCIVLPSLKDAPAGAVAQLRSLHENGVSLIAVSHVDGLEDLFGVYACPAEPTICRMIASDGRTENLYPGSAQFMYAANDAEVLLEAEGTDAVRYPVLIGKGKTLLINAPVSELGCGYLEKLPITYMPSISELLRETAAEAIRSINRPVAWAEGCGITLLKDRSGDTLLLAINYSPYEIDCGPKEYDATVMLEDIRAHHAESIYGPAPSALRADDGMLKGLWLRLHQQECALIRLT